MDRNTDCTAGQLPEADRSRSGERDHGGLPHFRSVRSRPGTARWVEALKPLHDLLSASLNETQANPRYAALKEISRFWVWIPGARLTPFEEQTLAEWKGGLYVPVVHCLASRDVPTRIAHGQLAWVCCRLITRPTAAVAYIDDPIADVRRQTISSFAQRGLILTDDMLLKHLHDEDAVVRDMANLVLKTRGLPQELIGLGGLMYSPRADQRVSVITLLKGRTDIDVVTWLIQLSRDPVETVRISALAALAQHNTPVVQKRLAEMARSDASEAVRQAAQEALANHRRDDGSFAPPAGLGEFESEGELSLATGCVDQGHPPIDLALASVFAFTTVMYAGGTKPERPRMSFDAIATIHVHKTAASLVRPVFGCLPGGFLYGSFTKSAVSGLGSVLVTPATTIGNPAARALSGVRTTTRRVFKF